MGYWGRGSGNVGSQTDGDLFIYTTGGQTSLGLSNKLFNHGVVTVTIVTVNYRRIVYPLSQGSRWVTAIWVTVEFTGGTMGRMWREGKS